MTRKPATAAKSTKIRAEDELAEAVRRPTGPLRPVRDDINLGERLRTLRKARGLSIEQVANSVGVTKSFLSRFERDAVSASVATLLKVCDAIGVRPGTLFDPPATNLVRAGEGRPISLGGEGMHEYLIAGVGNEHLMALLSVIEPGGGSGPEPYKLNAAVDFVHLKEGELDMVVDGELYSMKAGDTLTFPPTLAHTWRNPSQTQPAVAVWVIAPPI
ncbi:transcriptional regulator with XRE-family HTH domain [Paraburkholderia tropica]|uniref:helix-turn-helix domain-containing protein n=1 Tax=Paraburkholderia tropica TaxID=92647 RepID=UPI00160EA5D2|nr:helix-turn-helix domain-containing protein [Paraburkholderia tropica]MBB3000701.1 transcriptional regulator with XRE-family HTH domain [Paraburkholderia tropica]MBB6320330.1 transcriptional regulator with XRE-family HTH domain [Paraburkholderia tropica]